MKAKLLATLRAGVASLFLATAMIAPSGVAFAGTVNNDSAVNDTTCPTGTGLSQEGNNCKITVCHRTDSETNPYTMPTVSYDAATGQLKDNGQGDHTTHTGDVWYPGHPKEPKWGDIIPPIPGLFDGLNWTIAGQAIYNNDCNPIPAEVTPADVTFHDVCGTENDTYTIPDMLGVDYQIDGVTVDAGAFAGSGTVTVTAVAQDNFTLTGSTQWSHTFTDEDCSSVITPVQPQPTPPVCDDQTYVFNFDAPEHYHYEVNDETLTSGTSFNADGSTLTVTAVADEGFNFGDAQSSWDYTLTPATGCGGGEVTPNAVSFNDVCGTANDTYTVTATEGVTYHLGTADGAVVNAGTHTGSGTVTVVAVADEGFVFEEDETTSWTHTFTDEACPVDVCVNIDGVQTTIPNGMTVDNQGNCTTPAVLGTLTGGKGQVLGASTNAAQLVNTGSTVLLNLFAGLFMVGLAAILTIVSRKGPAQSSFTSSLSQ